MNIGNIREWEKEYITKLKIGIGEDLTKGYFDSINDANSPINIMMGSKVFTEGWDSNRVNLISFINIGSRNAKKYVLQTIGRGVRIEPFANFRQRIDKSELEYNKKEYLKQFSDGIKGIIFGNLFTGIFQGFCAFIVYSIFGVQNSFTFAFLTIIASFMPIIGTTIIWVPLGILFIIKGEIIRAIIFLIVSWFFITIPDNFVRPLLLGNRIELHPLFIFFAILGGVLFFGLSGIILGPLILLFQFLYTY